MSRGRIKFHLAAIELAIERDPMRYSEPFGDELHRIFESNDFIDDGRTVTAFVVLEPKRFNGEIKWVESRPLSDQGDEDEDEDE
jgi:hypothetical protein